MRSLHNFKLLPSVWEAEPSSPAEVVLAILLFQSLPTTLGFRRGYSCGLTNKRQALADAAAFAAINLSVPSNQ